MPSQVLLKSSVLASETRSIVLALTFLKRNCPKFIVIPLVSFAQTWLTHHCSNSGCYSWILTALRATMVTHHRSQIVTVQVDSLCRWTNLRSSAAKGSTASKVRPPSAKSGVIRLALDLQRRKTQVCLANLTLVYWSTLKIIFLLGNTCFILKRSPSQPVFKMLCPALSSILIAYF